MIPIEIQLHRYFLDQGGPYTNPHGVVFHYVPEDRSLSVSCDVPGFIVTDFDLTVDLDTSHATLFHFVHEYIIAGVEELNDITPELMLKRFRVGRATLMCSIDPELEEFLHFRRKAEGLWAKDNRGQKHLVPAGFHSPADLLVYTQHYYELKELESSPGNR